MLFYSCNNQAVDLKTSHDAAAMLVGYALINTYRRETLHKQENNFYSVGKVLRQVCTEDHSAAL